MLQNPTDIMTEVGSMLMLPNGSIRLSDAMLPYEDVMVPP